MTIKLPKKNNSLRTQHKCSTSSHRVLTYFMMEEDDGRWSVLPDDEVVYIIYVSVYNVYV